MKKIKVRNMKSNRGNTIANQFIITTDKGSFFQSYQSIVAFIPRDKTKKTLIDSKYWDYSVTTGKYRNIFLGEDKRTTQSCIDSKEYKLTNLN